MKNISDSKYINELKRLLKMNCENPHDMSAMNHINIVDGGQDRDLSHREHLLREAIRLTTGDRNATYGCPVDGMDRLAGLLSAYFNMKIDKVDAAMVHVLIKVSRVDASPLHMDNYIDMAAYAGIAGECAQQIMNVTTPKE